jgi:hypothetical protein
MMKRKISIIIISIICLSIFTYADFHELFDDQFPLTNFSEIYQNPNNQNQFFFTSMLNGVGIMTIDGAANITFVQNGTVGKNASPQILNNYAYFVENAELGNYSQIFKYDLVSDFIANNYGETGILGQLTIDSVGVTRTYYIKDNYLYTLDSNFIYQGSASGTTMSDINEGPVKIVLSPQNDQIFYILKSGSNKIYVADARASVGREFHPYIYIFKENPTENYIDFAFTTEYSAGHIVLGAVTDQQNLELYDTNLQY